MEKIENAIFKNNAAAVMVHHSFDDISGKLDRILSAITFYVYATLLEHFSRE